MQSYMFDTNVFNCILDGEIEICEFRARGIFYATHIQLDELTATSNIQRRQELLAVFKSIVERNQIPTDSFFLGVSQLGEAKLGDAENDLCSKIKEELDKRNKSKRNNIQDSLIAETAAKNGLSLVTHDADLFFVATKFGAACGNVYKMIRDLNSDEEG